MRNLIRALRGRPVQLSPKQEAKMAAQRARADAMIAKADADGRAAQLAGAQFMAGGASASVGGPAARPAAPIDPSQPLPPVRDMFKQAFEGFRDSVGEMFDDRAGIIDPGPGADMNRPPPELEDPAERTRVAAEERSMRERVRASYRAAPAPAIEFTRFATTGRTQLEEVVQRLKATGLAAAPERVFGVYRVPDRLDLGRSNENRASVEWEIAHAPGALAPAADDVLVTALTRDAHWVARRFGEPSVLDEDVAGALCARAGLQPEDCFGVTRLTHVRASDTDAGKSWSAHVDGALVLSRPSAAVTRAPSTWADQLLPASVSLARTCMSRVTPKQSSGCRPARAHSVPATSSSSTDGSPKRRATQWASRVSAVTRTSSAAGASAPGAWAISQSTEARFSLLLPRSRRSGTR